MVELQSGGKIFSTILLFQSNGEKIFACQKKTFINYVMKARDESCPVDPMYKRKTFWDGSGLCKRFQVRHLLEDGIYKRRRLFQKSK